MSPVSPLFGTFWNAKGLDMEGDLMQHIYYYQSPSNGNKTIIIFFVIKQFYLFYSFSGIIFSALSFSV